MKKTAYISLILFLLFSTSSCNQQKEINKIENYNKIASKFIIEIFSTEYYNCSYIIKPNSEYNLLEIIENEMPALNYRNKLMNILNINKIETLNGLLDVSKSFNFESYMFNKGTELIDANQYKAIKAELDSIAKYGVEKEKKQLFSKCPSEFYFISKPIFDKEYKIAVINIQTGFTCLTSKPRIFNLKDGTWK